MFSFSFAEVFVILFVFLVFIKPKEALAYFYKLLSIQEKIKNEVNLVKSEILCNEDESFLHKEQVLDEFDQKEQHNK